MDTDILVIIFFVIVSIISSIVKAGKKNAQKQNQQEDMFEEDLFEYEDDKPQRSVFDEIFGEEPKVTPSQQAYEAQFTNDSPRHQSFDDVYEEDNSSIEDEILAKQKEIEKKQEEAKRLKALAKKVSPGIELEEEGGSDFDFDPAKAIIYSEILKRPEY